MKDFLKNDLRQRSYILIQHEAANTGVRDGNGMTTYYACGTMGTHIQHILHSVPKICQKYYFQCLILVYVPA